MLKKIKNLMKKHKYILALIIMLVILAIVFVSIGTVKLITRIINEQKKEEIKEITYEIYRVDGTNATVLITFAKEEGIESISYQNYEDKIMEIYCDGRTKVAIDYEMEDLKSYKFKALYTNAEEKEFTIDFEIPRIHGLYTLKNGIYVNEPDISTGFVETNTRYMYLNDEGNLVPGNWIVQEPPENWYDYSNKNWANIFVENEGLEGYYVWIPRYCYKVDSENSVKGNERMDIKFINVYNQYIDGKTGEITRWDDLQAQGYKIPEAFSWNSQFDESIISSNINTIIPGYWMSKYQLSELTSYIIDYSAIVDLTSIEVRNIKINTTKTVSEYVYALDGIVYAKETADSIGYIFENITEGKKTVNVTALDENGEIIGSMTKILEVAETNKPDISSFDPSTTFYVYWDEDGNEHNEIPISMEAPKEWYNYSTGNWANIVTRNNGLESYFVWIPRYEYRLNSISQRTYVKFIEGTSTETTDTYKIPEAFWWDNNSNGVRDENEELTGYWMSKYQLNTGTNTSRINAEMLAEATIIKIENITGTLITDAETNGTNVKYEYYIDGIKKHEGTSSTENYIYTDLNSNTTYTINIIARNAGTNEYIGAITKKITTQDI